MQQKSQELRKELENFKSEDAMLVENENMKKQIEELKKQREMKQSENWKRVNQEHQKLKAELAALRQK